MPIFEPTPPTIRQLLTPTVRSILFLTLVSSFMTECLFAILPLLTNLSVAAGGLGLSVEGSAAVLGLRGLFVPIASLVLLPLGIARFGTLGLVRCVVFFYSAIAVSWLGLSSLCGHGIGSVATMAGMTVTMAWFAIADMASTASNLLLVHASPSHSTLGALQGLSQSAFSIARAAAPIAATSLFAFSYSSGIPLIWVGLLAAGALQITAAFRVRSPVPVALDVKSP